MSGNGFMYSANLVGVTVPNFALSLYEFIAASNVSLLLHSIRLEFVPLDSYGVAQDQRAQIALQTITTTGTGGTTLIPTPGHPRNTVPAQTAVNVFVTTPGTMGAVKSASNPSLIVPFERIFTPDQRILIPGGGRFAIALSTALGRPCTMSSEVGFEEL